MIKLITYEDDSTGLTLIERFVAIRKDDMISEGARPEHIRYVDEIDVPKRFYDRWYDFFLDGGKLRMTP